MTELALLQDSTFQDDLQGAFAKAESALRSRRIGSPDELFRTIASYMPEAIRGVADQTAKILSSAVSAGYIRIDGQNLVAGSTALSFPGKNFIPKSFAGRYTSDFATVDVPRLGFLGIMCTAALVLEILAAFALAMVVLAHAYFGGADVVVEIAILIVMFICGATMMGMMAFRQAYCGAGALRIDWRRGEMPKAVYDGQSSWAE